MISELELDILSNIVSKEVSEENPLDKVLHRVYTRYSIMEQQDKDKLIELINNKLRAIS